jgi:hypothetical protein
MNLLVVCCKCKYSSSVTVMGARGGAVGFEALRYKSEDRGFDSQWCHWKFSLTYPSGRTMARGLTQPLTVMSKVQQSRYRPGVAQRVQGS